MDPGRLTDLLADSRGSDLHRLYQRYSSAVHAFPVGLKARLCKRLYERAVGGGGGSSSGGAAVESDDERGNSGGSSGASSSSFFLGGAAYGSSLQLELTEVNVIANVFLSTHGAELTLLKNALDAADSPHDLLALFRLLPPPLRSHLLSHIRAEGLAALREWNGRLRTIRAAAEQQQHSGDSESYSSSDAMTWWPVKVYCDFDDTVQARLFDNSFPTGTVYPGYRGFIAAMRGDGQHREGVAEQQERRRRQIEEDAAAAAAAATATATAAAAAADRRLAGAASVVLPSSPQLLTRTERAPAAHSGNGVHLVDGAAQQLETTNLRLLNYTLGDDRSGAVASLERAALRAVDAAFATSATEVSSFDSPGADDVTDVAATSLQSTLLASHAAADAADAAISPPLAPAASTTAGTDHTLAIDSTQGGATCVDSLTPLSPFAELQLETSEIRVAPPSSIVNKVELGRVDAPPAASSFLSVNEVEVVSIDPPSLTLLASPAAAVAALLPAVPDTLSNSSSSGNSTAAPIDTSSEGEVHSLRQSHLVSAVAAPMDTAIGVGDSAALGLDGKHGIIDSSVVGVDYVQGSLRINGSAAEVEVGVHSEDTRAEVEVEVRHPAASRISADGSPSVGLHASSSSSSSDTSMPVSSVSSSSSSSIVHTTSISNSTPGSPLGSPWRYISAASIIVSAPVISSPGGSAAIMSSFVRSVDGSGSDGGVSAGVAVSRDSRFGVDIAADAAVFDVKLNFSMNSESSSGAKNGGDGIDTANTYTTTTSTIDAVGSDACDVARSNISVAPPTDVSASATSAAHTAASTSLPPSARAPTSTSAASAGRVFRPAAQNACVQSVGGTQQSHSSAGAAQGNNALPTSLAHASAAAASVASYSSLSTSTSSSTSGGSLYSTSTSNSPRHAPQSSSSSSSSSFASLLSSFWGNTTTSTSSHSSPLRSRGIRHTAAAASPVAAARDKQQQQQQQPPSSRSHKQQQQQTLHSNGTSASDNSNVPLASLLAAGAGTLVASGHTRHALATGSRSSTPQVEVGSSGRSSTPPPPGDLILLSARPAMLRSTTFSLSSSLGVVPSAILVGTITAWLSNGRMAARKLSNYGEFTGSALTVTGGAWRCGNYGTYRELRY